MQTIIKAPSQQALLVKISEWQAKCNTEISEDFCILLEAIMFTPYYNGECTAIVSYREADGTGAKIDIKEVPASYGATSERSVFSAMAGGTDGG